MRSSTVGPNQLLSCGGNRARVEGESRRRGVHVVQIAILFASIFLLANLQVLRALLARVFPLYHARALPPGIPPPPAYADLYGAAHAELTTLGFDGPHWFLRDSDPADAMVVRIVAVYGDLRSGTTCWLIPPSNAKTPNLLNASFSSRLSDGRIAISQVWDPYFAVTATEQSPARTVAAKNLAEHHSLHVTWIGSFGIGTDTAFATPAAMLDSAGAWMNRQREALLARGDLRRDADGLVRARWRFALRLLIAILRRPKPPKNGATIPAARLAGLAPSVERMRAAKPPAHVQWTLFGWSALLFAALGALVWNPRYALLVLIVIGVHELGHYFAMLAFGYRNVHMLALPLVGGVTIGQEASPSAAKRAWMSLMGPLPGIVIGWLLLALPFVAPALPLSEWTSDAASLFLVINYLNLLPIPPLDGARVVQAMLPPRWYGIQAGFVAVTCVAGAIGAGLMGLTMLVVLALFQLSTLPAIVQGGRLLKKLLADGVPPADQPRSLRLRQVLDALEKTAGPARAALPRINQAEAVLNVADQQPMRWWQRLLLAAVLVVFLVGPGSVATLVYFTLFRAPQVSANVLQAQMQTGLADQQAFKQRAQAMSLADLAQALAKPNTPPASDDDIRAAEARLGQPLPEEVAALYRNANGILTVGIVPLADVGRADAQELAHLAQGNAVTIFSDDHAEEVHVALDRATRWLRLGKPDPDGIEQVYYDADAQPAVPAKRLIRVSDEAAGAMPNLRAMLESDWIGQRLAEKSQARFEAALQQARAELRVASVPALVAEFRQPGLVEKLVLHAKGWNPGVDDAAIAAAGQRIGQSLPTDLAAFYRLHDGAPMPLGLLEVESLARAETWPTPQGKLDATTQRYDRDFTLIDEEGAKTGTTRIEHASLQHCVVLGGTHLRPGSEQREFAPSKWWCPADSGTERWIDVWKSRIYPNFHALLADAAAAQRAMRAP